MAFPPTRILDFYSGIGVFHYALDQLIASREFQSNYTLKAFDMNENANRVYEMNFHVTPSHRNILFLPLDFFEDFNADLWLMSPPCQPFTRKGKQSPLDRRSDSFVYLIGILQKLKAKPAKIVIENVLGFEKSLVFEQLVNVLLECGYNWQGFHLNPLDFGEPNSRPRLFIVCSLQPLCDRHTTFKISDRLPGQLPIKRRHLAEYLEDDVDYDKSKVPDLVLWQAGSYLDFCCPSQDKSNCFTKAYTQFVKGGGAVLISDEAMTILPRVLIEYEEALVELKDAWENRADLSIDRKRFIQQWSENACCPLSALNPRYFTPREICNLHQLSSEFKLTGDWKSQYKLLGNSMSAKVVQSVLAYAYQDYE